MAQQPGEWRDASWRISAEAQRLLELLARKAGTSQAVVFEQAIREKAEREQVVVEEGPPAAAGLPTPPPFPPEQRAAAMDRFRQLTEKARAADPGDLTPEEIENEVGRAIAEVREEQRARRR